MPRLQNLPLSKNDFDSSGWQKILDEISEKNCEVYYSHFFQEAATAQENGDTTKEEIFTLLGGVCSMSLNPDTEQIFHPHFVIIDPPMRGFMLEDFGETHISVFAELTDSITDPEMRARLADVIWVKGRSKYYKFVEIAVRAYLASAQWLLTMPDQFGLAADIRLDRALFLAMSIRNESLFDFALETVEKILISQDKNDKSFPFTLIMRLLLKYDSQNFATFSQLSEELAKSSESKGDWLIAPTYWQIKADWDIRAGNVEDQKKSLINAAEANVKFGEIYASLDKPNYGAACFQLERAIDILRTVGGMRTRCEEIQNIILEYQKASLSDFERISIPLDARIREVMQQAQGAVQGLPLNEAILKLASAEKPPKKQEIRQRVESYLGKASFQHIIPVAIVDADGRRTDTSPALIGSTEEEKEKAITARMYMETVKYHHVTVQAIIMPVVEQILSDHYIRMNNLFFLVQNNSFIPPNRVYFFLKGFYLGFQNDYLTALHILVPQIENSLRYILSQREVVTSSINTTTGIQEDFTLETLLEMPQLESILGEDIVFNLKCLLIRKFGANLRNRLSHGLMQPFEFSSHTVIYLWWFILYLCYQGIPFEKDITQNRSEADKSSI